MSKLISEIFAVEPTFDWLKNGDLLEETLPTTRNEDWKYFSLRKLAENVYKRPATEAEGTLEVYSKRGSTATTCKIVFVNGRFSGTRNLPQGVKCTPFSELGEEEKAWFKSVSGQNSYASKLQSTLCTDGVFIEIDSDMDHIDVVLGVEQGELTTISAPVICVKARSGSDVTISLSTVMENKSGVPGFLFTQFACEVEENARVKLVSLSEACEDFTSLSVISGQVAGKFHVLQMDLGEADSRIDGDVLLANPGAICSFDGLVYANNEQKKDHRIKIFHGAKSTYSHQLYKTLVDEKATASFGGCIQILPNCSKSEADQLSQNMLLSEESTANSQPQLMIDNEDVKCSHGATYSQPNEDHVFYLQSRGISADTARSMLCLAFAEEVLLVNEERDFSVSLLKELGTKIRRKLNA